MKLLFYFYYALIVLSLPALLFLIHCTYHIILLYIFFPSLSPFIIPRTLETFQIPFESDDLAILICNSNVRHELSHSEYPTRRKQCAKALELMGLKSYKDATIKSLEGKFLS